MTIFFLHIQTLPNRRLIKINENYKHGHSLFIQNINTFIKNAIFKYYIQVCKCGETINKLNLIKLCILY